MVKLQGRTFDGLLLFTREVMSDCLWSHGLQHARLPCFSVSWSLFKFMSIELVILSNQLILAAHFSFCLLSFPASGSFLSPLFTPGGQSIRVSASVWVLLMNIQGWYTLRLTDMISYSLRDSQESSNTIVQKHQFLITLHSLWFNSHIHTWLLEKP